MPEGKNYGNTAGCCWPTGNKYRGGHDDGSVPKSKHPPPRGGGSMNKKHSSPAHNPY